MSEMLFSPQILHSLRFYALLIARAFNLTVFLDILRIRGVTLTFHISVSTIYHTVILDVLRTISLICVSTYILPAMPPSHQELSAKTCSASEYGHSIDYGCTVII